VLPVNTDVLPINKVDVDYRTSRCALDFHAAQRTLQPNLPHGFLFSLPVDMKNDVVNELVGGGHTGRKYVPWSKQHQYLRLAHLTPLFAKHTQILTLSLAYLDFSAAAATAAVQL
jgi:hypothetical protein